jgi:hypothetical protein
MDEPYDEHSINEIDGGGGQQLSKENKKNIQSSWNKMIETLGTVHVPITQEDKTVTEKDISDFLSYGIKSSTFIDLKVPLSDKEINAHKFGLNTATINNEKIAIIRNLTIRYCSVASALIINYNIPADVWYLQTDKACGDFNCTDDYILLDNSHVRRSTLNEHLITELTNIESAEFNVKWSTYMAILVKYFYLVIVNNNKLQSVWESFIRTIGTNVLRVSIGSANLIKNKITRQQGISTSIEPTPEESVEPAEPEPILPEEPITPAEPEPIIPEEPITPAEPEPILPEEPITPAEPEPILPEEPEPEPEPTPDEDEAGGIPLPDDADWNDLIDLFDIEYPSDADGLLQKVQQQFHIVLSTQILNKITDQNLSYIWVMSIYASVDMSNRIDGTSMPIPNVAEVTNKMNAIFTGLPVVTEYKNRYTMLIEQLTAFLKAFFDVLQYSALRNSDPFFNNVNLYASSITSHIITAPPAILPPTNPRDLPVSISSQTAKITAIIENYFSLTVTYQIHYKFSNVQISRIWSTAINAGCGASGMFCGTDSDRLIANYLRDSSVDNPAYLRHHTVMESLKGIMTTPLIGALSDGKTMLDVDKFVKGINDEAFQLTTEETSGGPLPPTSTPTSLPNMPVAPTTPLPFPDEDAEDEEKKEDDEDVEPAKPTLPVEPPPYESLRPLPTPTPPPAPSPTPESTIPSPTTTPTADKGAKAEGPGTASKVFGFIYENGQRIIFGMIVLLGIISTIVLLSAGNAVKKPQNSEITVTPPPAPIVEIADYTRQMVNDGIVETTRLNNSYNILYDNKNVDYRHSYYKNLSITTMQKWEPYFFRFYIGALVIYAVVLLAVHRNMSYTEKTKSFLWVAVITNVYVLKMVASALFLLYTNMSDKLPKLFMY